MAGKNRKRIHKAQKAGMRSLVMPREHWRMIANMATFADAMSAAGSLAGRCRALSSKAEYLLGEPENSHGRIRGDLTGDEWETLCEIAAMPDAPPQIKILAETLEKQFGANQSANGSVFVHPRVNPAGNAEGLDKDFLTLAKPANLQELIDFLQAVHGLMSSEYGELPDGGNLMENGEDGENGEDENEDGLVAEMMRHVAGHLGSAIAKLQETLEALCRDDSATSVGLAVTTVEAGAIASCVRNFREIFNITIQTGNDSPDTRELNDRINNFNNILDSAKRFFGHIAEMED